MLKLLLSPDQRDAHEFKPVLAEIEDHPGSPLGRVTFWLVIAVFLFFVGWMCLGEIDVVVSARGKILPDGSLKVIQPLETGVISQILVKEGDFVRKGQDLMIIDPSTTAPELQASRENLYLIEQEKRRLRAEGGLGGGGGAFSATQARLHQASMASLHKQLAAKEEALNNIQAQISAKEVERAQTQALLLKAQEQEARLAKVLDIIAKSEYERVAEALLSHQKRLEALAFEIEQLRFQQQQTQEEMQYLRASFQTETLTALSEREKQSTELSAQIQQSTFRNQRQTLKAPVDGYIHELKVHTIGGVVTPAQEVMTLVPAEAPLLVEATVLNKDIGFIRPEMPVSLKIDTFDFQKYGTVEGKVTQIAKNSTDDEKLGPVYRVLVRPVDKYLVVDGEKEFLSSGLSLTSEIKVGKRKIIEFFIYPLIKHLDEGMSVR